MLEEAQGLTREGAVDTPLFPMLTKSGHQLKAGIPRGRRIPSGKMRLLRYHARALRVTPQSRRLSADVTPVGAE
jgi:hypothetical protein